MTRVIRRPSAAANPAIASLLQSTRPAGRVAELGSFGLKMETVEMRSSTGSQALRFADRQAQQFNASFTGIGAELTKMVIDPDEGKCLVEMFAMLAADWRSREGVGLWTTERGELQIYISRDSVGHTNLGVTLVESDPNNYWSLHSEIVLEFGGLDFLAKRLSRFFDYQPK